MGWAWLDGRGPQCQGKQFSVGSREPQQFLEQRNRPIKKGVISHQPSFASSFAHLHIHRLKRTCVFLFSTPVCPFFVFHASEGKLCQQSALLAHDSHLLVTKGYSKKHDPLLTASLPAAISRNLPRRGVTVHLCPDDLVAALLVCLSPTAVWGFADILTLSRDAEWRGGVVTRGQFMLSGVPKMQAAEQRPGLELGQPAVMG